MPPPFPFLWHFPALQNSSGSPREEKEATLGPDTSATLAGWEAEQILGPLLSFRNADTLS